MNDPKKFNGKTEDEILEEKFGIKRTPDGGFVLPPVPKTGHKVEFYIMWEGFPPRAKSAHFSVY